MPSANHVNRMDEFSCDPAKYLTLSPTWGDWEGSSLCVAVPSTQGENGKEGVSFWGGGYGYEGGIYFWVVLYMHETAIKVDNLMSELCFRSTLCSRCNSESEGASAGLRTYGQSTSSQNVSPQKSYVLQTSFQVAQVHRLWNLFLIFFFFFFVFW